MKRLFATLLIISVFACKKAPESPGPNQADSLDQAKTDTVNVAYPQANKEEILKKANDEVLQILKNREYSKLSGYIHPEKGIRFSMYAFVSPKEDKQFSKNDFEKYQPTRTLFTWGTYDGSGDLYKATINDYLKNWVYAKDFVTGKFSLNEFQGKGNSLNNLREIYPKADFTENYIQGSKANAEMDWKSLRLIFEEFNRKYYLVGIINDQWTI